jgi:hypothetical protein
MTLTLDKLKAAIQKKDEEYQRGISTVAMGAMAKFIKPFCRKRRVVFTTGMGSYCFSRMNGNLCDWDEHIYNKSQERYTGWGPAPNAPEGYQEVYAALHLDVPPNGELFEWMTDYDPRKDDPPKLSEKQQWMMRYLQTRGTKTRRVFGKEIATAKALVRRGLATLEPLMDLDNKPIPGGQLVRLTLEGRQCVC